MSTSTQIKATTKRTERVYTATDMMREIFESYPKASDTKRRAIFISRVRDDDMVAAQIIGNWFDRYKFAYEKRSAPMPVDIKQRDAERKAAVSKIADQVRQIVLLDMVTPNGKKLRDLTGHECRQTGGWFAAIAQKVKAKQKVGAVLSEIQVRSLWAVAAANK